MAALRILSFSFFILLTFYHLFFHFELSFTFGRVYITPFRFPGHQNKLDIRAIGFDCVTLHFSIIYSIFPFLDIYLHSYPFRDATSGPQNLYKPTYK